MPETTSQVDIPANPCEAAMDAAAAELSGLSVLDAADRVLRRPVLEVAWVANPRCGRRKGASRRTACWLRGRRCPR